MSGVRFMRVLGVRAKEPSIVAFVDGHRVRWTLAGWECTCPTPGDAACGHIDAVADLIDPRDPDRAATAGTCTASSGPRRESHRGVSPPPAMRRTSAGAGSSLSPFFTSAQGGYPTMSNRPRTVSEVPRSPER